jgi:hypothetical protein
MRENRVRENVISNLLMIRHINGAVNLADLFTKEMKDVARFVEIRDLFMQPRPLG